MSLAARFTTSQFSIMYKFCLLLNRQLPLNILNIY